MPEKEHLLNRHIRGTGHTAFFHKMCRFHVPGKLELTKERFLHRPLPTAILHQPLELTLFDLEPRQQLHSCAYLGS